MTTKDLLNPFKALYQDNVLLSDKPEIKELNQYAMALDNTIAEEFNLEYLISEFAHNQLAFVRNGLLLAKIKFLKLYKDYGDGTFVSFCREKLGKQRWQINDTIRAARVVLELMHAGFEILPNNISQAIVLAKLSGEQLIEKWRMVIEKLTLDQITAKSIRNVIKPPEKKANTLTTILVTKEIQENMQREATKRGLSIVQFLEVMLEFFLGARSLASYADAGSHRFLYSGNSHLLQSEINTPDYTMRQPILQ